MNCFKLLIVEDNDSDLGTFKDTLHRYMVETGRIIELVECDSVNAALAKLDNSLDGAIIDMKLGSTGDEGNTVIKTITQSNIRIPIVVITGTPDAVDHELAYIEVHKKGEIEYTNVLNDLWEIHDSGMTRIMGGRGTIEELLNKAYHTCILPQKAAWKRNGSVDSHRSEASLLRHTLNHLIQQVNQNHEQCFPEEFYIQPPLDNALRTGLVVSRADSDEMFVVLNPLCDLTPRRNGRFGAVHIILAQIESENIILGNSSGNSRESKLTNLRKNNTLKYHCLPATDNFSGGFVDFERLHSIVADTMSIEFSKRICQISPSFIKDLTSRFSAYLGRQGQPEVDFPISIANKK